MTPELYLVKPEHPEPCLAVVPILTPYGVQFPLIFREKGRESWWDLPGGKRALDESPLQAVEKECFEEVDLIVSAHAYIGQNDHPMKQGLKRFFFAATYLAGTPVNKVPDEHLDMQLFNAHDAVNLLRPRVPEVVLKYMPFVAHNLNQQRDANTPMLFFN